MKRNNLEFHSKRQKLKFNYKIYDYLIKLLHSKFRILHFTLNKSFYEIRLNLLK